MSKEVWRDVVGYEGWYQVSNKGQVKRIAPGLSTRVGRILTPSPNTDGYSVVNLHAGPKHTAKRIHQLVAEAFIGSRPSGCEINHKNLDKSDNRLENLEYVTHKENMNHAMAHKGMFMSKPGEANNSAKLTQAQVDEIRYLYSNGQGSIRQLAKQFGVSKSTVGYIVTGHIWR